MIIYSCIQPYLTIFVSPNYFKIEKKVSCCPKILYSFFNLDYEIIYGNIENLTIYNKPVYSNMNTNELGFKFYKFELGSDLDSPEYFWILSKICHTTNFGKAMNINEIEKELLYYYKEIIYFMSRIFYYYLGDRTDLLFVLRSLINQGQTERKEVILALKFIEYIESKPFDIRDISKIANRLIIFYPILGEEACREMFKWKTPTFNDLELEVFRDFNLEHLVEGEK